MATVFTELLYVKAERYKEGQNAKLVGWHRNSQPGGWWQQTGCVGAIFQCAAFALHAGYYFSVRQAFVVITRFKATSMHWLWLICFVYGGIFFFSRQVKLQLVETAQPLSSFLWMGNRAASQGGNSVSPSQNHPVRPPLGEH